MVFGVEKNRGPVARLDWGEIQTKNYVPIDIFSQGHEKPLARHKKSP